MKTVFPHDFYFWMLESLFLSQILSKFRPAQPYVFVVQERWVGECPLPFDGSVLASLTVALYDRGKKKKDKLKSSHLFHAETHICKTLWFFRAV